MTLVAAKGFDAHGRVTRKAEFLTRMDALVPWVVFCEFIGPHYPKPGNGRPQIGIERMLRMYLVADRGTNRRKSSVLCQGRATLPDAQAHLGIYQGPISRPVQERQPSIWDAGDDQAEQMGKSAHRSGASCVGQIQGNTPLSPSKLAQF